MTTAIDALVDLIPAHHQQLRRWLRSEHDLGDGKPRRLSVVEALRRAPRDEHVLVMASMAGVSDAIVKEAQGAAKAAYQSAATAREEERARAAERGAWALTLLDEEGSNIERPSAAAANAARALIPVDVFVTGVERHRARMDGDRNEGVHGSVRDMRRSQEAAAE